MANNRIEQPVRGAYTTLEQLIAARFAAHDINLQQHRAALSLLTGPNKTNFRGRGIDFAEVRAYQPGDDIRTIDWRVTARSGGAYTKLFNEERERPLLIITDQRQNMFFGSQTCFKSVAAAYLSAMLAWSGLNSGDRVGGLIYGNDGHREIRPRRSRKTVLSLINQLHDFNHQLTRDSGIQLSTEATQSQTLLELRRIARPGSSLFLIGDFSGFQHSEQRKQLHQLARHCEITAIFIYDPLERELPPPGQYSISNGRQRAMIDTAGKHQRQHYTQQFEQRKQWLRQQFGQLGIPMIDFATTDAPLQTLLFYYSTTNRQAKRVNRS